MEDRRIAQDERRREVSDADAKRDAQRRMAWFSLTGMVVVSIWRSLYRVDGAAQSVRDAIEHE